MTDQILLSGISPTELSELIVRGVQEEMLKLLKQLEKPENKKGGYLSTKEACEFLKCSSTKLWRLRKEGKINSRKFGRNVLYKQDELEDFISKPG